MEPIPGKQPEEDKKLISRRKFIRDAAIFVGGTTIGFAGGTFVGWNLSPKSNEYQNPVINPSSTPANTAEPENTQTAVDTQTVVPTGTPLLEKPTPTDTQAAVATEVQLPAAISPQDYQEMQPHMQHVFLIKGAGTMKDTRDREDNPPSDQEIEALFAKAREMGATHIDINTPYDQEFRTNLRKYAAAAHKSGPIILRGNFARTEGWYENRVPKSSYFQNIDEQVAATKKFLDEELTRDPDFLRDFDWFDPAPEPENAKRLIGNYWDDKEKLRNYMRKLYIATRETLDAHGKQGVNIIFGHNADVALDQDESFWRELGDVVGIDNNVATVAEMDDWCKKAKHKFPNTKIIMLEYGAPTDRTGDLDEHAQALFVAGLLRVMVDNEIDGANYQTVNNGSSTLLNRTVEKVGNNNQVVFTAREAYAAVSYVYHAHA